ncbi:MAG: CC0125/CC1285 family lipoprotein [Caulobacter sp.]|jgi:CubicO group peptidase (beta-lactamase class C family)
MNIARAARIAAIIGLAGTLMAACATATPYQPNVRGQAVSGGYSDERITSDRFRVSFSGNSLTSRETVERYLLFRAAELTLAEGYDGFVLADRETTRDSRTYFDPPPGRYGWGYGYWRPSWRYFGPRYGWRRWDPWYSDRFWADDMDMRTVTRFEATAEIVMYRGPSPSGPERSFNAREVVANLGPGIVRPEPR